MESVSLQDLIKDVASAVRDLATGTTTGNGPDTVTFVDSGKGNNGSMVMAANQWAGTQVIFEEPAATAAGLTTPGPHTITNFNTTGGIFTATPAFRASGVVPLGLNYFLVRAGGRGNPY